MALPLVPLAVAAGLGVLYLATRGPSAAEQAAAAAKAKALKPAGFPPELQPELDKLLNAPPDQDPAALEVVATRLEGLGFKEQATSLRLKAAQLRASQGAAPPTTPAPPAPRTGLAFAPPTTRFVPGEITPLTPTPGPAAPAGRVHVPIPTRTLRPGMTGQDVREWQEFLIFKAGPTVVGPSGADGVFGSFTTAATKAFQRSVGLTDDGIPGPNTFKAALAAGY